MKYQLARNGQTYGPYSLEELRQYLATGNVQPTDMAVGEGMEEWQPVSQVLGIAGDHALTTPPPPPAQLYPGAAAPVLFNPAYRPPPNLHWVLLLVLGAFCSIFHFIWIFVQAAWMREVDPKSQALHYYSGSMACLLMGCAAAGLTSAFPQSDLAAFPTVLLLLAFLVLLIVGHFKLRDSLEQFYNGPEPIGLKLSGPMTLFFNTVYFQYHFNRINEMRRYAGLRPY